MSWLTSFGHTPGVDLEKLTAGIEKVRDPRGLDPGGEAAWFFTESLGVELSWAQRETALVLDTSSGSAELFDMNVSQRRGNFVHQYYNLSDDLQNAVDPFTRFEDETSVEAFLSLASFLYAGVERAQSPEGSQ